MKTPKRVTVAKKTTVEDKLNALRWESFIRASGLPYEELSEEWYQFFSGQSDPTTASTELVKLVDRAIEADVAIAEKLK